MSFYIGGSNHTRYSAAHLLASFRFSTLLRNRSTLSDALEHAIHVTVQEPSIRKMLLSKLHGDGSSLPVAVRAYTISRHLLTIDVALMLASRAKLARVGEDAYWWWFFMDSSPQAKRNWFLSVSDGIRKKDVVKLFAQYTRLANSRDEAEASELREEVPLVAPMACQ